MITLRDSQSFSGRMRGKVIKITNYSLLITNLNKV